MASLLTMITFILLHFDGAMKVCNDESQASRD